MRQPGIAGLDGFIVNSIRYIGIDLGAETAKAVELVRDDNGLSIGRRRLVEHCKHPGDTLVKLLREFDWDSVAAAAATGRASRMLRIERVPTKVALVRGVRYAFPEQDPVTLVSIGAQGFSVLELRGRHKQAYRENSRCSQGTGNFLRQLVRRFDLTVAEAGAACTDVEQPAPLSGRCPVILKTDMTHLANKGESRAAILAGLYDAVCENVQVLINPRRAPPKVLLTGGVPQAARVRRNFKAFLERKEMQLVEADADECRFLEALGAALVATEHGKPAPAIDTLFRSDHDVCFESIPPLADAMGRVKRMPPIRVQDDGNSRRIILGLDIGSTGSKALALDRQEGRPLWEAYIGTKGDPIEAARRLVAMFLEETACRHRVTGVGVTGSGREAVGATMASCFGTDRVFVLNEIAAHAAGACFFDPAVDTIFEIGGQDAKYIRLDGGRICDLAMNEACSAGTGSFIAEQGDRFQGVSGVAQMGRLAMAADRGISLGQHCSVFMAEVIEEAVSARVSENAIIAGIYEAVIQNYLNRVKGNRSVGKRIFCQGMPFASDALAAAVARQTGSEVVVPPCPGTMGALGIALLAADEIPDTADRTLDLPFFLGVRIDRKDTFVCRSNKGCGGAGNKCRIDRILTTTANTRRRFLWGGSCSLYDAGNRHSKLADRAPDPFRERRELLDAVAANVNAGSGRPLVAMTAEFALAGLLPFFAPFVKALGFDVKVWGDADRRLLKRGIEEANIPFCAPMQLYQGIMMEIVEAEPDYLLLPRLRELPRQKDERNATNCPIVQASPDLIAKPLSNRGRPRILTPIIDIGAENLDSARFQNTTRGLARALGAEGRWEYAYELARKQLESFNSACLEIGRRALEFATEQEALAVVVMGRTYTLHNPVLNSNVPNLLRERGVIAIPVDCYPVDAGTPVFTDLYWGYAQANLRAAHQVRRARGVYAVYCSNYSCGPDSFILPFFSYVMANKPFAVIETDGHSGDAGTKTRIEAFLYCVEGDRRLPVSARNALRITEFKAIEQDKISLGDCRRRQDLLLIPRMGPSAEVIARVFQAEGFRAESLPIPTRTSLRLGRRYTSGKECLPMTITLGSLLERLQRDRDGDERFAFFMPTANGPCRFGVYNLLHKIVVEATGWKERLRIVAPGSSNYFQGMSTSFKVRAMAGFVASDLLLAALHDVRPVETEPGTAQAIYDRYFAELLQLLHDIPPGRLLPALTQIPGEVFGVRHLLHRAANDFAQFKDISKNLPTVALAGEIYIRLDPFANDFIIERLEARGLKVVLAPFSEWIEYTTSLRSQRLRDGQGLSGERLRDAIMARSIEIGLVDRLFDAVAAPLGWGTRTRVEKAIKAASPYIDKALIGEAVLTLGHPLYEYQRGTIDGVVAVGPHECMPNKVAEAQFIHAGDDSGLISLTLPVNGDPIDPELLDRFAFEVKEHQRLRNSGEYRRKYTAAADLDILLQTLNSRVLTGALRGLSLPARICNQADRR